MTVNLTAEGYEALRERTPTIEWYAELQKADGTAVRGRYALAACRTSAANITPMTFALPITGADVTLPCQIERVVLYETATGGDPLSDPEAVEPLLLVLAADRGTVNVTVTLPAVA